MRWCRSPSPSFLEHMVLLVCRTRICVCKNWATKCSQSLCICWCLGVFEVVRDSLICYRKYNPLPHKERKYPLCLTSFKSLISSCSCYIIWVHAATETIESTLSKISSVGKTWEDVDEVFKLETYQIVLPITCKLQCTDKQKSFYQYFCGVGTKQTNFAICDCLIMWLEARPVADSKTILIMSPSERFKSLLKGFTGLEMHLIFCLLLDTMNYTHFASHIFSNTKVLGCLVSTWREEKIHAQLPSVHFIAAPCPKPCVFSWLYICIYVHSGSNFLHLQARLLLLNYLHIHSSLAAQGIRRGAGGSRRQRFCLGHRTDQRWDHKVLFWSRFSI